MSYIHNYDIVFNPGQFRKRRISRRKDIEMVIGGR